MASKELFRLLNILDQRDIGLSKEDIIPAFESPEARVKMESWMREYLANATLLTKEELAFFERHGTGNLDAQSTAHPMSDGEIMAVIHSLAASTAAIEKHTQRLEAQRRALVQLRNTHNKIKLPKSDHTDRTQQVQREKAQLDLEINKFSMNLDAHLQASLKQGDTNVRKLSSSIERILEKDDRLLDGLNKLMPGIIDGDVLKPSRPSIDQINQLCDMLTNLTQLEVQHRAESIYCTALSSYDRSFSREFDHADGTKEAKEENEMSVMRAELAELTGEIPSLLSLVISSQYRKPLIRRIQAFQCHADLERSQWSDYLVSTLEYLTSRIDVIGEHLLGSKAHRDALASISEHLHPELASLHELAKNDATRQRQLHSSPGKDSKKGLRPLVLLSRGHDGQDPALTLIRHLNIANVDGMNEGRLTKALDAAVVENRDRQTALANSAEDNITRILSESLAKGDQDIEDLLSAVYAYSPFAAVKPVDEKLQTGLDDLQDKTESLGLAVRQLDLEGITREIRAHQSHLQGLQRK